MTTKDLAEAKPGNILVVDDTPANLGLLVGMLKSKGYLVRPAPNGRIALQAAEMQPPDLIMLDINMPEMDGYEVCQRLKQNEKLSNIPVIFISALTETLDKVKAFGVGGVDYVTKPFQFEEVEARIETHLKLYRLQALVEKWNLQLANKVREQIKEIHAKNEELISLLEKKQKTFNDTILAFSNLMELRNSALHGHSSNVATISEQVAVAMGLQDVSTIRIAALLHDIGKIGASELLLYKNVELMGEAEYNEYKLHAIRGQLALELIDDFHEAGILIRHHHENYDGTGFPDGLKGEAIPLGSRIIGMADFFDRSVQEALQLNDPIQIGFGKVSRSLGTKLDPRIYHWFTQPVLEFYSQIISKKGSSIFEVSPLELEIGMVLSESIWSGTGVLMLIKGSQLTEKNIQFIRRLYQNDPPKTGIFIIKSS